MTMKKLAFRSDDVKEPTEYIRDMFTHTNGHGLLYIPVWPRDDKAENTKENCYPADR